MLHQEKGQANFNMLPLPIDANGINHPTPSTNDQPLFNDLLNVTGEREVQPAIMNFCKYFF